VTENSSLLDRIQELVDSGKLELPVFNQAAAKLQMWSTSDNVGTDEVERLILSDQVLVAEVLRAANSPFFGGLSQVHTVRTAIVRLGLNQVAHLALMASHKSTYEAKDPTFRKMIHLLWSHASATALAANWLVRRLGFGKEMESEALVGGLLHDVGKLVILRAIDEIKSGKKASCDFSQPLIDEILATAHPALGYTFLRHWDVPEVYCEIARDHHLQEFDQSKIPLVSVRLADHAGSKMGLSLQPNPSIVLSALPEAQCLNAGDILLAELEIMMEDSLSPVTP
jgi:HD-like signal output (HDOD) protein